MEPSEDRPKEIVSPEAAKQNRLNPGLMVALGALLLLTLGGYWLGRTWSRDGCQVDNCREVGPFVQEGINRMLLPPAAVPGPVIPLPARVEGLELNVHRSPFGRWLYSDQRRQAEKCYPELAPLFAGLEKDHQAVHRSARDIAGLMGQGQGSLALAYYRQHTLPALQNMIQTLCQLQGEIQRQEKQDQELLQCTRKFEVLFTSLGESLFGVPCCAGTGKGKLAGCEVP
ncbi:MAG: CZB domain-containing protein [Thermodesulfobacteriota bacterium]